MIRVIAALIIASASLWLTPPAAAQSEIDPDHFDNQGIVGVQPRSPQSNGSAKSLVGSLKKSRQDLSRYEQVQRHRVQASKGTRSPAATRRASSSTAAAQRGEVSGATRVSREAVNRKASEQSQLAPPSHRQKEWLPQ